MDLNNNSSYECCVMGSLLRLIDSVKHDEIYGESGDTTPAVMQNTNFFPGFSSD